MMKQENAWDQAEDRVKHYADAMDKNTQAIVEYEDLLVASTSNNLDEINAAIDKSIGLSDKSLADQLDYVIANRDSLVREFKGTNDEITADDERRANLQLDTLIKSLKDQTTKLDEMSPELEEAWRRLGEKDRKKFNEAIKDLPDDVKSKFNIIKNDLDGKVTTDMAETGKKIGKTIGENVSDNMKVNNKTFASTLGDAISTTKLPKWLKNSAFGKVAESMGFSFAAEGGFFNTGEMFVAREAGPEMVGKIGNKTAVANNDQITNSLTNALVVALDGMDKNDKPHTTIVNIGSRKVYEGIGDYIDSENDRYGTSYVSL